VKIVLWSIGGDERSWENRGFINVPNPVAQRLTLEIETQNNAITAKLKNA
jgi:hypothetical protein